MSIAAKTTCTILVAEDRPDEADVLRDFLGMQDYAVVHACDGEEAVIKARVAQPDPGCSAKTCTELGVFVTWW